MEERVTRLEALAEKTGQLLVEIGAHLTKLDARSEGFATKDDVRAVEARLTRLEARSEGFATKDDVRAVEVRLTKLEARSESFATKDDASRIEAAMHRELNAQTWKLIGVVTFLFTAAFGLGKFVH